MLRPSLFVLCSSLVTACGSLVNEASRLQQLYDQKNAGSLYVVTTDPADNSVAPYNQTYVDVTFSAPIDPATFTAQGLFGGCSGSFQLSYDLFGNCLGGTVDTSANPRIRFIATIFPKGLGLQIRTTSAILSATGVAATPYTSSVGFKLGAPCGNANCFFSYSTPLMTNVSAGSGIFPVRAGTHAGKYLVYMLGQSTTTLLDPVAITSEPGPSLTPCGINPGPGAHSFLNNAGTKEVLVIGSATLSVCFFDHASNSFAAGAALKGAVGAGAYAFKPQLATSSEFNNRLIVRGGITNTLLRFLPDDTDENAAYTLSATANTGAHGIRVTSGGYANKWLHFGNSGQVSVFTEDPAGMVIGYNIGAALGGGAASFEVLTGIRSGQVITIHGGGTNAVYAYSLTGDLAAGVAPTLSPMVNTGALLLRQAGNATENEPVLLHGASAVNTTSVYNPSSGNFDSGPVTTGAILSGSSQIFIPNAGSGAFFIVNGALTPSTSVYLPGSKSFSGTRMPLSVPNAGAHAFRVTGGSQNGKTLIVAAGSTTHTALYDPIRHIMDPGPDTQLAVTSNGFSIPIIRGNHAGKVFTITGNTNTYRIYDPGQNLFVDSGTLLLPAITGTFSNFGAGSNAFAVANNNYLLFLHGGGNTTSYFDQSSGAISAGPSLGACTLSIGTNVQYTKPTGGGLRQFVMCTANSFVIFDHASPSFSAPTTMSATGNGRQLYVIPSGPQAGNILVVLGGGSPSASIINADTLIETTGIAIGGPGACGNSVVVDFGAQLLPIPFGANAGKALLLVGGGSPGGRISCLYDPATNSFGSPQSISLTGSPGFDISNGSVAFRTYGGLYPTSYIVLTGANKNVWSTYVP